MGLASADMGTLDPRAWHISNPHQYHKGFSLRASRLCGQQTTKSVGRVSSSWDDFNFNHCSKLGTNCDSSS